jgi:oligopeptidase A
MNPLCHPRFDIPFDRIRAADVVPAVTFLIAAVRARLDALVASPAPRTYEGTMKAFDDLTEDLDWAMHIVTHLEAVATTPELRAAHNAVLPEVSSLSTQILSSEGLFAAVRAFAETEAARGLDPVRARFVKKTLDDFRREGATLAPERKARLEALNRELDDLTTRFGENVIDATAAFEVIVADPRRVSGLPESALTAARRDAQARGKEGWRFTLQAPSYTPVLSYADDAELRRTLYLAYYARCASGPHDNRATLSRILGLRREKARLLGYAHYADYVLEDRMAKNGATARAFVDDLARRTRTHFERETAELEAFRREREGPGAPPLEPWDVPYYAEKLRRSRYEYDPEALRPYFPLPRVLSGLFEIVRRLYGIDVREVAPGSPGRPPTWHESVRYFDILEPGGARVGAFYGDFFPRETKRGGAWMGDLWTRTAPGEPHVGVICANLTPPIGDAPALLTHDEVETIFHEFGHLLHHCLSQVEVRSLSGTHVSWDFVELPSQIMENWCWETDALNLFARHHETGQPLPAELRAKMLAARNFRSATMQMRQLGFAALDLALHIDFDPASGDDPLEFARRALQSFSPVPLRNDYALVASFNHLFDSPVGYAAGYYSYKWAEVLDADTFTRFQREGIFDSATGAAFRDCILSRGDSDEPIELFRSFMGRDPDPEALMRRNGLTDSPAGAPNAAG